MSDIAYVKGAFFFRTLEQTVGRKQLDLFLKSYFTHFAYQTITADRFIDFLERQLLSKTGADFNYREWIYEPGLPPNCVSIAAPRLDKIKSFANEFNAGKNPFKPKVKIKWVRKNGKRKKIKQQINIRYSDYLIQEWQLFIRALDPKTKIARLTALDHQFQFSQTQNSEILCDWFVLAAQSDYIFKIQEPLEAFLLKVGRRKFVLPIYEALSESPDGLKLAKRIFFRAKSNYHSVTKNSVWKVLYKKA